MKLRCIKLTTSNMIERTRDLTVGKIYEGVSEGLFYMVLDDIGDMWSYENELFEVVTESTEENVLNFIKTHKLDFFTGTIIKCMIRYNQTQDKEYLTKALDLIETII